jgi:hypothetical protein
VTDQEVFLGGTSEDKCAQKRLGLFVGLVSNPRELPEVRTARTGVAGVL